MRILRKETEVLDLAELFLAVWLLGGAVILPVMALYKRGRE